MIRKILLAAAIAGTLDIALASSLTVLRGKNLAAMLRFIASGPFPQASGWGTWGSLAGIVVHFFLMGLMAAIYVLAWRNFSILQHRPFVWGVAYGLATFIVLDLIVVPMRFPAAWPPTPAFIGTQLFAHLVLVGMVFALVVSRGGVGAGD